MNEAARGRPDRNPQPPLLRRGPRQTVFVLSTGRTGTMAVARCLNDAYENVTALHEPKPTRHLRIVSHACMAGRISLPTAAALLFRTRRKLFERVTATVYVESNPHLNGFLPVLQDVVDEPRVLHVVRHPRDYVRSALNFGVQRGLKRFLSAVVPYWIIKPEQIERQVERRWRDMSPVERFAWFWNYVNGYLDQGADLYARQYLRVQFEDLFRPDGTGIRSVADWMEIEEQAGHLESILTKRFNPSRSHDSLEWERWEQSDREALLRHCSARAETYGYFL